MKKYISRHKVPLIISAVFIVLCIYLILKNKDSDGFLSASVVDIATILIGVLIAFFLTERYTDKRRRNDCIEHIILEIEEAVSSESIFSIERITFLKQQSCANRIKYLKDAAFPDLLKDIEFIETNFDSIRDLYSHHNTSADDLSSVYLDMEKYRDNITDKCCKIRVELYKV